MAAQCASPLCTFCFKEPSIMGGNPPPNFLQFISRFANVEFTTWFEELNYCGGCLELVGYVGDLFQQMEGLRLQLEWKVGELLEMLESVRATSVPAQVQNGLRGELLKVLKKKKRSSRPIVLVDKLEVKKEVKLEIEETENNDGEAAKKLLNCLAVLLLSIPYYKAQPVSDSNQIEDYEELEIDAEINQVGFSPVILSEEEAKEAVEAVMVGDFQSNCEGEDNHVQTDPILKRNEWNDEEAWDEAIARSQAREESDSEDEEAIDRWLEELRKLIVEEDETTEDEELQVDTEAEATPPPPLQNPMENERLSTEAENQTGESESLPPDLVGNGVVAEEYEITTEIKEECVGLEEEETQNLEDSLDAVPVNHPAAIPHHFDHQNHHVQDAEVEDNEPEAGASQLNSVIEEEENSNPPENDDDYESSSRVEVGENVENSEEQAEMVEDVELPPVINLVKKVRFNDDIKAIPIPPRRPKPPPRFICEICGFWCNSRIRWNMHFHQSEEIKGMARLRGARHLTKKKGIKTYKDLKSKWGLRMDAISMNLEENHLDSIENPVVLEESTGEEQISLNPPARDHPEMEVSEEQPEVSQPSTQKKIAAVDRFKCDFEGCVKTFQFQSQLIPHQLKHRFTDPYYCWWPRCSDKFRWSKYLTEHLKKKHEATPELLKPYLYRCRPCNFKSKSHIRFALHLPDCQEVKRSKKPKKSRTPQVIRVAYQLSRIMLKNKPRKKKGKASTSKTNPISPKKPDLQRRMSRRLSKAPQIFHCIWPGCSSKFAELKPLKFHLKREHKATANKISELSSRCAVCSELFPDIESVSMHMTSHAESKENAAKPQGSKKRKPDLKRCGRTYGGQTEGAVLLNIPIE